MMTLRRVLRRGRDDSGAAIIEFALVAPLLLALVWGIIEAGRAFYTVNSLASAVRDGARYGAASCPLAAGQTMVIDSLHPMCKPAIQRMVVTAFRAIGDSLQDAQVDVNPLGSGQATRIEVRAHYPYAPIVPISGWNDTMTMTRSAVFRYERLP